MIKKTALLIAIALFAQSAIAADFIKISSMDGVVSIKTPTGDTLIYKSFDKIPGLSYGSRISSVSGVTKIKIFNTAEVVLEKDQGVFITKNPITNAIELKKRESKNQKSVKVILANRAHSYFGADTVISITEQYPSVYFKVVSGKAVVVGIEGKRQEMVAGDRYGVNKKLSD
jgi:hypothetical protein